MEITRNVIIDLLPLYLADEVSADTRALVEEYLKTDPQLVKIAKQSQAIESSRDIPVPLTQDDNMQAFRKAKRLITLHSIILAGLISIVLVIVILVFFLSPS